MTYYCPNCSIAIDLRAPACTKCGADFGAESSWSPVAIVRGNSTDWLKVKGGKGAVLIARLAATFGLMVGLLEAGGFFVVFGTLSIPLGVANSPVKGSLIVALAYVALSLYALVLCWVRPPFTPLVVFLAVIPFTLQWVVPLMVLGGLVR